MTGNGDERDVDDVETEDTPDDEPSAPENLLGEPEAVGYQDGTYLAEMADDPRRIG